MRFEVEWLDAPGVRDCVLSATWARLRIEADGADVTELIHVESQTRRTAVYGPIFPVAEWFIENWWSLLYEASPTSPLRPGRGAPSWKREWVRRHNLLGAREGTALPDAAFVRDGNDIIIRWDPDPKEQGRSRVRFVGSGQVRVDAEEFSRQATSFVEATLQRLSAVVGENEDLRRAAEAWTAIQSADQQEQDLCRSLALLGLDPYDPDEATDDIVNLITDLTASLPATLRNDLLEGSRPGTLQPAANWLTHSRAGLANGSAHHEYATLASPWAPSAHQTGYQLARQAREHLLRLDQKTPINDLDGLLVDRLGWDADPLRKGDQLRSLDGLVGLSKESEKPVVIDPGSRTGWAKRFLLARSAFFTVTGTVDQGRLLTRAVTRPQRAARAFAAELLAPASAIADRLGGLVSQEEVAELSEEFGVNPLLIQHQLENHGLGSISA
jgi:hypothetical protein